MRNGIQNKSNLFRRIIKSSALGMNNVSVLHLLESGIGLVRGTLPDQIYQKSNWNSETQSSDVEDAYLAPQSRLINYMALTLNHMVVKNMKRKEALAFTAWALLAVVSGEVFIARMYNYFIPGNSITTLFFENHVVDDHVDDHVAVVHKLNA